MRKVLFTTINPKWPVFRQTPGGLGLWGDYQFTNDQATDECDIWIVDEDLPREMTVRCPPENTLLIANEHDEVHRYSGWLTRQFQYILTCNPLVRHPRILRGQLGCPWHVGIGHPGFKANHSYDSFKAMASIPKTKLLSMVTSNKTLTRAHHARSELGRRLKAHFGDRIDVYGKEFLPLPDKWDSVHPYKYHVVIENGSKDDWWTEKLSDTYLGMAFPLYWGCPNVDRYFSPESFERIDLFDPAKAIASIESAIAQGLYEMRVPQLADARTKVLEQYNLFATLAGYCDRMTGTRKQPVTLTPSPHPLSIKGRWDRWSFLISNAMGR